MVIVILRESVVLPAMKTTAFTHVDFINVYLNPTLMLTTKCKHYPVPFTTHKFNSIILLLNLHPIHHSFSHQIQHSNKTFRVILNPKHSEPERICTTSIVFAFPVSSDVLIKCVVLFFFKLIEVVSVGSDLWEIGLRFQRVALAEKVQRLLPINSSETANNFVDLSELFFVY